jgi:hypothetical protein
VISSVASFIDSVQVEINFRFRLSGSFEFLEVFGLTMRKAIGARTCFVLKPLCPFAGSPKIDHFSHLSPHA